jgi:hypothetical protein
MGLGLIDGAVDLGEETNAVPHGDLMLGFPVMPLEIAETIAGRGGIGLGVVQVGLFEGGHVHFRRLVDDMEFGVEAPLVFGELKMKRSLFLGNRREFQLLPFDRIPFRERPVADLDGPKDPVFEINLHEDGGRRAGERQLIDARDFRMFRGRIGRPDLERRGALKKGQDEQKSKQAP